VWHVPQMKDRSIGRVIRRLTGLNSREEGA
jgi:hypothetical protein